MGLKRGMEVAAALENAARRGHQVCLRRRFQAGRCGQGEAGEKRPPAAAGDHRLPQGPGRQGRGRALRRRAATTGTRPATILGLRAGKHVYVEKPCSHNPREGELMIAAARKHDRVVQMGTQRRSTPASSRRSSKLHDGRHRQGRTSPRRWYNNRRPRSASGKEHRPAGGPRLRPLAGPGPAPAVSATTASTTTGTGSGTGAPASSATTASTASTSAAGASASTTPPASSPPAAATASTTTRRRPTPTSSLSSSRAASRSSGKG